jgi:hypothetical protein
MFGLLDATMATVRESRSVSGTLMLDVLTRNARQVREGGTVIISGRALMEEKLAGSAADEIS